MAPFLVGAFKSDTAEKICDNRPDIPPSYYSGEYNRSGIDDLPFFSDLDTDREKNIYKYLIFF